MSYTVLLKREGEQDKTREGFSSEREAVLWAAKFAWPSYAWWIMPGEKTWRDYPKSWSDRS